MERASFLFYLEDGPNLVIAASNAGAADDPAWWLNLQAAPEAFVDLPDGIHAVVGRAAGTVEQDRLWPRFVAMLEMYSVYAASTERTIAVIILEPADLDQPRPTVA